MGTVVPIRPPPRPSDWRERLCYKQARRGEEELIQCKANAVTILRNDPAWIGVLAWNELSQGIVCREAAPWHMDDAPADPSPSRPWSDSDGCRVQNWLQRVWSLTVSEQTAYKAALMAAEAAPFDPLRDWLLSLEWDGVTRVDRWLTSYLGVEESAYSRFVGRSFLIGSVARALRPGCKMDTMLILEGRQGLFKSQAVERLYGSTFFRDTPIDLRNNDRFLALRDCWCREWPELDGHGKTDQGRVKSFLSAPTDDFRAPYARNMVHQPRRCVLVATVNPPQFGYLVDESGNRRMWPVECGKVGPIDLEAIEADREQIWAEARTYYHGWTDANGVEHPPAKWWASTADERRVCNQQQEQRMVAEIWEGKIGAWLAEPLRAKDGAEVTVRQILGECLNVPAERWDRGNSTRVGICLSRCEWIKGRRDGDGDREQYYVRKPLPMADDIEREGIAGEAAE